MNKQKLEKSTAHAVPDKTRQSQLLVPLTEAQLEAITGGDLYMHMPRGSNNLNN